MSVRRISASWATAGERALGPGFSAYRAACRVRCPRRLRSAPPISALGRSQRRGARPTPAPRSAAAGGVPVAAIGGIRHAQLAEVAKAGARMAAVLSALACGDGTEAAARALV